jgi:cysteinyl-tRNA synthetase
MEMDAEAANEAIEVFKRMDEVLGVVFFENEKKEVEIPAEVKQLLDARAEARKSKNWAESDRLRDAIAALGWAVKDSKEGQTVAKKS